MRVVPVLDLMQGQVVRGVAGNRSAYRPVASDLVASAAPAQVAAAFACELNLRLGYLADLDAIAGAEPNWPVYSQVLAAGLNLWVDAGVANVARAAKLASFSAAGQRLAGIVVGLESVATPAALAEIARAIPPEQRIFSLDLQRGQPLSQPGWENLGAAEIAAAAVACAFNRLIVLDLAQVGVAAGISTENLCRELRSRFPALELIGGGGVRNLADLQQLHRAGCQFALVASALHNRSIGPAELATLRAAK